ncbi:MAG: hypothetical protein INQ03_05020 [Candidatus Heimdallarchaeota archaeon]|nr:hypothetical protein [Candidatus Heimdallarchaeota archaeon]
MFTCILSTDLTNPFDQINPLYSFQYVKNILEIKQAEYSKRKERLPTYYITSTPYIPPYLIGFHLDVDRYYSAANLEAIFKFLDTCNKSIIILDTIDILLNNKRIQDGLFFEYLFESAKQNSLEIIFMGVDSSSDRVDCNGNRYRRAKWQFWMLKHARGYGVTLSNEWIIKPKGYTNKSIQPYVIIKQRPYFSHEKQSKPEYSFWDFSDSSMNELIPTNLELKKLNDQCVLIDQEWRSHKSRYLYTKRVSRLQPKISMHSFSGSRSRNKSQRARDDVNKAINVIKYASKQKSIQETGFIYFKIKKEDEKILMIRNFMDTLVYDKHVRDKIVELSSEQWLIPFFSIFYDQWVKLNKPNAEDYLADLLKYPQIENWLGEKNRGYFVTFDAKKVISLARKLAKSIQVMNAMFNIPRTEVGKFLHEKEDGILRIYGDETMSIYLLQLPSVDKLLTYGDGSEIITLGGQTYMGLKAEQDFLKYEELDEVVYEFKVLDIRADGNYWNYSYDYRLSFNILVLYIPTLNQLIEIEFARDVLTWKPIGNV